MEISVSELAYAAGLFDGEGWFSITRSKGHRIKRDFCYQVHAGLVMRERSILTWLQRRFGGTVRKQKRYSDKHSFSYRWRTTGKQTLETAKLLKPYLMAKKKQAGVVIDF